MKMPWELISFQNFIHNNKTIILQQFVRFKVQIMANQGQAGIVLV